MRQILYILIAFLSFAGFHSAAKDAGTLLSQAEKAYGKHDYRTALSLYEEAAKHGNSTWLQYNMGNTHYRLGNKAKAILCYERALLLDASNSSARSNLQLVREKHGLKAGISMSDDLLSRTVLSCSSDRWSVAALLLFILALLGAVAYMLGSGVALRKAGFFGGLAAFVLCALTAVAAIYAHNYTASRHFAIVTQMGGIKANVAPREAKAEKDIAFDAAEGIKIELLDSVTASDRTKWLKVEAADKIGWVQAKSVERI